MSLAEIEVHFTEMTQISDEVAQLAENLQKIIGTEGMDTVNSVREAWVSDNAGFFIKKGLARMETLQKRGANLLELSADIQKRATQIYEAERWNELTAMTRRYF